MVGRRATCAVAAIAAGVAVAAATPASAAGPWKGIYDCYTYMYPWGLTYQHSVRLKAQPNYQHAFNHQGSTMVKPTPGKWKWKAAKKRIVFTSGPMKPVYGGWSKPDKDHPKGFFNEILKDGSGQPGSCYPTQFK